MTLTIRATSIETAHTSDACEFVSPSSQRGGAGPRSLTKTQMVEAILELNSTADREWLMGFDFASLRGYWLRLQHAFSPRGNGWRPAAGT